MCGFVGVCSFSEDARVTSRRVLIATGLIAHRGPDDESFFESQRICLGFRRLKIIDLSDRARQPFHDASGRHTLVFNGEIYNYVELREELTGLGHRFKTQSDTEVLLHGLIEWGQGCLHRLNGMFAFAWWDSLRQKLTLARDRFGEKPLFYSRTPQGVVFASEIKALFPLLPQPPKPNQDAIFSYLAHGDLEIAPHTFWENIYSVRQASQLAISEDQWIEKPYWTLEETSIDHANPAEQYRELFLDSLRLRARSDVPIGTCLSGGLDSSSIVCGLGYLEDQGRTQPTSRKTFSASYGQYSELPQIQATVKKSRSQSFVTTPVPESLKDLAELIGFHDEPFHSFAAYASYAVMRLAKENDVIVVLNGQGADESLAGYGAYVSPFLVDTFLRQGPLSAARAAAGAQEIALKSARQIVAEAARYGARKILGPIAVFFRMSRESRPNECFDTIQASFLSRAHRLIQLSMPRFSSQLKRELFGSLFTAKLPLYLRVEDRNSMANSIESRLPFLDHRLIEFAFSVRPEKFMSGGKNKWLLRDAMADLLPSEVSNRKEKFGFPVPQSNWLFDVLANEVRELLRSPSEELKSVLKTERLAEQFELHLSDRRDRGDKGTVSKFWFRVVSLELWFRHQKMLSSYCQSA